MDGDDRPSEHGSGLRYGTPASNTPDCVTIQKSTNKMEQSFAQDIPDGFQMSTIPIGNGEGVEFDLEKVFFL